MASPGFRSPGAVLAAAGVAALAGVVGWRLRGASYPADVETICQAEARSGLAMRQDMAAVSDWVRANLGSPGGNELYSALGDLGVRERAERLQAEAAANHVAPCPLVDAYGGLAADAEYRADMQRLCSRATLPELAALEVEARAGALATWIDASTTSSRARALGAPLRGGATCDERSAVLREAARAADVLTCDVANALCLPLAPPLAPPLAGVTDAGVDGPPPTAIAP